MQFNKVDNSSYSYIKSDFTDYLHFICSTFEHFVETALAPRLETYQNRLQTPHALTTERKKVYRANFRVITTKKL